MNQTKINNTGIFCCYFRTSFCSANPNFGLRPKLGGQISVWTERKTDPKSEVINCQVFCHLYLSETATYCSTHQPSHLPVICSVTFVYVRDPY